MSVEIISYAILVMIVSAIRNEIASRLDIDSLQEVLASH